MSSSLALDRAEAHLRSNHYSQEAQAIADLRAQLEQAEQEREQLRKVHEAELGVCEQHCEVVIALRRERDEAAAEAEHWRGSTVDEDVYVQLLTENRLLFDYAPAAVHTMLLIVTRAEAERVKRLERIEAAATEVYLAELYDSSVPATWRELYAALEANQSAALAEGSE